VQVTGDGTGPASGPGRSTAPGRVRVVAGSLGSGGRALGSGSRAAGVGAARLLRRGRVALRKNGAGPSGLAALTELCVANAAADALVAVVLTSTIFFNVPIGQARSKVGLYLLITMAPFALLAPVIGPVLDRLHGRRVALAATLVARGALAWLLAGHTRGIDVYPLAFGLLMLSRAFTVARAAVTPRVLPPDMTLLSANSRVSLVGSLGGGVLAPVGLGLQAVIGVTWTCRFAAVAFFSAAFLCRALPARVDRSSGERPAQGITRATLNIPATGATRSRTTFGGLPMALRSVIPVRALVGFLTLFLAFQFYQSTKSSKTALAEIGVAALIGSSGGIAIGNRLGRRRPELLIVIGLLLATGVCVFGAFAYSTAVAFLVALIATLGASFAKLGLDAIIQRDVPEQVRNSAFARSETTLQLVWVVGGALGLIKMSGTLGFSLAAAWMVGALTLEVAGLRGARRRWIRHRNRQNAAAAMPPRDRRPSWEQDADQGWRHPDDVDREPAGPRTSERGPRDTGTLLLPFPDDE
jgi:hypothetical protein